MAKQQVLEKIALAASVAILVAGVLFWFGQVGDVLEFLELVAEADG